MPVKKTLFAIANLLLLAVFVFLGLSMLRFVIEAVPNAMRGLQPRSFILLPLAIVFIAKGERIKLRNWKFRRA